MSNKNKTNEREEIDKKIKTGKAIVYITLGLSLVVAFFSILTMVKTKKFDFLLLIAISLIITSFLEQKKIKKLQRELNSNDD